MGVALRRVKAKVGAPVVAVVMFFDEGESSGEGELRINWILRSKIFSQGVKNIKKLRYGLTSPEFGYYCNFLSVSTGWSPAAVRGWALHHWEAINWRLADAGGLDSKGDVVVQFFDFPEPVCGGGGVGWPSNPGCVFFWREPTKGGEGEVAGFELDTRGACAEAGNICNEGGRGGAKDEFFRVAWGVRDADCLEAIAVVNPGWKEDVIVR